MIQILGEILPPGSSLCKYFKDVWQKLSLLNQYVLDNLFSQNPFRKDIFLRRFKNKTLRDVEDAILEEEKWLNEIQIKEVFLIIYKNHQN